MTNEEIRIKVAEAMGWEVISDTLCNVKPDKNGDPEIEPIAPLPNYPESLNACAEFEKTLTDREHFSFRKHLWDIVIKLGPEDTWDRQFVSADAKTRCIAYLKTKGILP